MVSSAAHSSAVRGVSLPSNGPLARFGTTFSFFSGRLAMATMRSAQLARATRAGKTRCCHRSLPNNPFGERLVCSRLGTESQHVAIGILHVYFVRPRVV